MFHSSGCSRDYVQLYDGASIEPGNLIRYGSNEGRLCNRRESRFIFYSFSNIMTVYYRTDGSNVANNARG